MDESKPLPPTKYCTRCKGPDGTVGRWHPIEDFYRCSGRISSYCRECASELAREQYRKDRIAKGLTVSTRKSFCQSSNPLHLTYKKLADLPVPPGYARCTHPFCLGVYPNTPEMFPVGFHGLCKYCRQTAKLYPHLNPFDGAEAIPEPTTSALKKRERPSKKKDKEDPFEMEDWNSDEFKEKVMERNKQYLEQPDLYKEMWQYHDHAVYRGWAQRAPWDDSANSSGIFEENSEQPEPPTV